MWRVLVVLALAAGLVWFLAHDDDSDRRTVHRDRPLQHPGEKMRAVDEEEWDAQETTERPEPAVLFGTVFDPNGRPVWKAEVSVLHPRPSWMRFSGNDGAYELKFRRAGKYLVEASLHIDLAPQRHVVEIPETGDPLRVDFHLKPAGYIFGEVVVGKKPVWHGFVDIEVVNLFGDAEYELDTDIDNGFFNFAWEPPKNVPLRLIVRTEDGFMKKPIEFQYTGEKLDLGKLKLTRYPTMRVRMRLPDGKWAEDVAAVYADQWTAFIGGVGEQPEQVGWASRIRIPSREGGTARLVLEADDVRLIREVDLVLDQLYELEVNVRAGPVAVRARLFDETGDPVQARFRVGEGPVVESSPEGWFSLQAPHGGAFIARLTELHVPDAGWFRFDEDSARHFVVDADDARGKCVIPTDRRVLAIVPGDFIVNAAQRSGEGKWWCRTTNGEFRLHLSPRLPEGRYRWHRKHIDATTRGEGRGAPFTVRKRGWTIIDAR